jgi:hypothetical protein
MERLQIVYSFVWKLFSHTDSAFNTSGFNDCKHALKTASHHENGQAHRKCVMTYYNSLKESGSVDTQSTIQLTMIVYTGRKFQKES